MDFPIYLLIQQVSGWVVSSHMVFVRIHCTEKCPTSFHNNVLSESK